MAFIPGQYFSPLKTRLLRLGRFFLVLPFFWGPATGRAQDQALKAADHYELTEQWDESPDPPLPDQSKPSPSSTTLYPDSLTVDSSGNVYLASGGQKGTFLRKFTPQGKCVLTWTLEKGSCGCITAYRMATDPAGNLYVGDSCCNRILVYSPEGKVINQIGGPGSPKTFNFIAGMAVEDSGNIFESDSNQIHEFSPDGKKLLEFGKEGSWDGEFKTPGNMALDGKGHLYVADNWNGRIEKFSTKGDFQASLGEWGPEPRRAKFPGFLRVGPNGDLFAAGKEVQWFDPQGQWVKSLPIGGAGFEPGRGPAGEALDAQGNLFLVYPEYPKVLKFTPTQGPAKVPPPVAALPGQNPWPLVFKMSGKEIAPVQNPMALALDPQGSVDVLDQGYEIKNRSQDYHQSRLIQFSPDLVPLRELCANFSPGTRGNLESPAGMALDPQNRIYIADTQHHRVQVFDQDGLLQALWGTKGSQKDSDWLPTGIAVDGQGHVFVTDISDDEVQKFTPEGKFLGKWGGPGKGAGKFRNPYGIAVDPKGRIYVADTGNDRVQVFNEGGKLLDTWKGGKGHRFRGPQAVAVGPDGRIWVGDTGNQRLEVFSPKGKWESGRALSGNPAGLAPDAAGNLYWADSAGHLVEKLGPKGEAQVFGKDMENGNIDRIAGVYMGGDGNLLLTSNGKAFRYGLDGKFLGSWQSEDPKKVPDYSGVRLFGLFLPRPSGEIWILQGRYNRLNLLKYSNDGKLLGTLLGGTVDQPVDGGVTIGEAPWIHSLPPDYATFDSRGDLFVADIRNYRVLKFDSQLHLLKAWGRQGNRDGDFQWINGMVMDSHDRLYVLESETGRVQVFDTDGHLTGHWTARLDNPNPALQYSFRGLFLDPAGDLLLPVMDAKGDEVYCYTTGGEYLTRLSLGILLHSFDWDKQGNMYYTPQTANNEIHLVPASAFKPTPK